MVTGQPLRGCGPNRKPKSGDMRSSGGMAASQLYPIYDRLVRQHDGQDVLFYDNPNPNPMGTPFVTALQRVVL